MPSDFVKSPTCNVKLAWPLSGDPPQRIYSVAACIPLKAPKAYLTETGRGRSGFFLMPQRRDFLHFSSSKTSASLRGAFRRNNWPSFLLWIKHSFKPPKALSCPNAMLFLRLKNASLWKLMMSIHICRLAGVDWCSTNENVNFGPSALVTLWCKIDWFYTVVWPEP